ncbi:MAG: glycosyltransferase family 87 protein, partial [Ignavibacteriaceae bacterium]
MSLNSNQLIQNIHQYRIQLLWGIALILSAYFIYFVIVNASLSTQGFASYYTASKLLAEGEDVSRFYDDDWFSSNAERFVQEVYEIFNVNMPTTSLIMLPLVKLDYSTARIIWTIFNFVILFAAVLFLIQKFNYKEFWTPLILILFLSYQPLYANILFGQTYILIFCLLIVAWYAYVSGNEKLLGAAIGLIFILKSTSFIFWLFLLVQRRWRSLVWGLLTVSVVILFSLPWIGFNAWQTYAGKITGFFSNPSLCVTAYQTLHSFFHHLTSINQQWNPEPLINLPLLGNLLSIFSVLIIAGASSFIAFKRNKSEITFGIFIIAGLIISPVSLDYHYTILLLPILMLINNIR